MASKEYQQFTKPGLICGVKFEKHKPEGGRVWLNFDDFSTGDKLTLEAGLQVRNGALIKHALENLANERLK